MCRHSTVRHSGHHLSQQFGAHITHRKHTGDVGLGGLIGDDVAVVQLHLSRHQLRGRLAADADEYAVQLQNFFLAGEEVLHPDGGQALLTDQLRDGAAEAEFDVFEVLQGLMVDFRRPEGISSVYQNHLLCHPA